MLKLKKVILTNPRSKSRSDLGFSLKSDFPTTHPHPRESIKQARKRSTTKIKFVSLLKLSSNMFLTQLEV